MTDLMILPRQPTSEKVRAVLEATAPGATWHVGLSAGPTYTDPPGSNTVKAYRPPYFIVYPMWASLGGPGLGPDRECDAEWTYQVTMLALRGDQLEWMRDHVVRCVFGKNPDGSWLNSFDTPESDNGPAVRIIGRELTDDTGTGDGADGVLPSDFRFKLYATRDT